MIKTIVISVLDERVLNGRHYPHVVVSAKNGGDEEVNPAETAGILLLVYTEAAKRYIHEHPIECKDCLAFESHKIITGAIEKIQSTLQEKHRNEDR